MKRFSTLIICVLLLILTAACAEGLNIVCTSFPCYDAVRSVVGQSAHVDMLLKPGSEVHTFDPTPADILAVANCDLFVYVGGESDAWVEGILSSFGEDAPVTLRLFDCVEARKEEIVEGMTADEEPEDEYDEHIWTSPVNEMAIVEAVNASVDAIDPDNAASYDANASETIEALKALDGEIRALVENAARREIVVADRFPLLYFVREYGLDYCAAFPSCAAESEPSAKTIMYLIDRVREDSIPAIFTLEMSSARTAQAIASETGAEILTYYSMQNISAVDFEAGESYLTLMRRNIEALKRGLN